MRVLIDTNVILDVLSKREHFYDNASKLFRLCEVKLVEGYISALSVADIVYILRKELDPQSIKDVLNKLSVIFYIEDLKASDLKEAADMKFKDYEDAIQSVCASRIKADYIATRNTKDFSESAVKALTPEEILERV